jgi:hypothetical protein
MDRNILRTSVVAVYAAGVVNLPGAALEYAGASQKVTEAALPGCLTWFFQLSPIRYAEARYRLIAIPDPRTGLRGLILLPEQPRQHT